MNIPVDCSEFVYKKLEVTPWHVTSVNKHGVLLGVFDSQGNLTKSLAATWDELDSNFETASDRYKKEDSK